MPSIINATVISGLSANSDTSGTLIFQTSSNNVLTLDSSQNAAFAGSVSAPNTFGFKNRIINGDMRIDQRNAGASVTITTAEEFITDRWFFAPSANNKLTAQQSTTAPTGFNNSLLLTSSAATSVAAGDYYFLQHKIEGFNFADCGWGSASAQTITLSFWCRSSITGTYGGALVNSAQNRSYPFTYTISTANTFEYKTVTIAGDTSGTWIGATNGTGVRLRLGFGIGSTYSGTSGAWAASNYMSVTSATNWISTSGATFYITGVQLEKGSQATPFDFRDITTELQKCQRYFVKTYNQSSALASNNAAGFLRTRAYVGTYAAFVWLLPVSMRIDPTATIYNSNTSVINSWYNTDASTSTTASVSTTSEQSITVQSSTVTTGATYLFHLTGSAEL